MMMMLLRVRKGVCFGDGAAEGTQIEEITDRLAT